MAQTKTKKNWWPKTVAKRKNQTDTAVTGESPSSWTSTPVRKLNAVEFL